MRLIQTDLDIFIASALSLRGRPLNSGYVNISGSAYATSGGPTPAAAPTMTVASLAKYNAVNLIVRFHFTSLALFSALFSFLFSFPGAFKVRLLHQCSVKS